MSTTTWTLVSRNRGARFYRPVANVPAGLEWEAATALARRTDREDSTQVWVVPTTTPHVEDRDNVLEDSGKRVPIRWDAEPRLAAPLPAITTDAQLRDRLVASGDTPERADMIVAARNALQRQLTAVAPAIARVLDPLAGSSPLQERGRRAVLRLEARRRHTSLTVPPAGTRRTC